MRLKGRVDDVLKYSYSSPLAELKLENECMPFTVSPVITDVEVLETVLLQSKMVRKYTGNSRKTKVKIK